MRFSWPARSGPAPGVVAALGLIVLYFLLQLLAGGVLALVTALFERHAQPGWSGPQVHQAVMQLLHRPDNSASLVVISLPLITLLLLWLVRRGWPELFERGELPGFGFAPPSSSTAYGVAVALGLLLPPLGGALTAWLSHGHAVSQNVQVLAQQASLELRLLLAVMAVLIGPLSEEMLFRGVLLSALAQRMAFAPAAFVSALLFGLVHLDGLGFQWYAVPNLVLLGLVLAWLRQRSCSLWPAVLTHGIYNAVSLVVLFSH